MGAGVTGTAQISTPAVVGIVSYPAAQGQCGSSGGYFKGIIIPATYPVFSYTIAPGGLWASAGSCSGSIYIEITKFYQ